MPPRRSAHNNLIEPRQRNGQAAPTPKRFAPQRQHPVRGQANPDGQDLVANWYMREPDPKSGSSTPASPLSH